MVDVVVVAVVGHVVVEEVHREEGEVVFEHCFI